jgi:manganese oxidase
VVDFHTYGESRLRISTTSVVLIIAFAFLRAAAYGQADRAVSGRVRTYYIAAEEVNWDYVPRGLNVVGTPIPEGDLEKETTTSAKKTYLKAVYHEYINESFETRKARPAEWEHLGILGPLIRAEVGDTVRVVFKNRTNIFCSIHPHGLAYSKDSEGAVYSDGTTAVEKQGGMIKPGGTYVYTWNVPERAGPAHGDPSSIVWMYHSHFVEPRDINTGLLGPIIVTAKGSARTDGTPKDVDREFITAFAVFDETESWYFGVNVTRGKYSPDLKFTDPIFRKLNLLYSINGLVAGNLPPLIMKRGERVRWYLLSNSNEDDVHSVHWHGQTVLFNQIRTDMVALEPMMMGVADMIPDNVGTWLLHCHVNEHIKGGMQALFTVTP